MKLFLTLRKLARTCKDKVSKLVRVKGLHLKNHTGDRVGTSTLRTYLGKRSDNQVIAVPGEHRKRSRADEFEERHPSHTEVHPCQQPTCSSNPPAWEDGGSHELQRKTAPSS